MANVIPEFTVRVTPVPVKVRDEANCASETVIENPPSTNTSSLMPGTDAPGDPPEVVAQVEVEFQLPEATEKRFAALVTLIPNRKTINTMAAMKTIGLFVFLRDIFSNILLNIVSRKASGVRIFLTQACCSIYRSDRWFAIEKTWSNQLI